MEIYQASESFVSLPDTEKCLALARFPWELTIAARATAYGETSETLSHPQRIIWINELQHRVSSYQVELALSDVRWTATDFVAGHVCAKWDDPDLEKHIEDAFIKAMKFVIERLKQNLEGKKGE